MAAHKTKQPLGAQPELLAPKEENKKETSDTKPLLSRNDVLASMQSVVLLCRLCNSCWFRPRQVMLHSMVVASHFFYDKQQTAARPCRWAGAC